MYCTLDDLVRRFGRDELITLTDKDGAVGDVVPEPVNQAIDDATATINGYLSGRYSLPLPAAPENLNRIASDLARYYLHDDVLDERHQAYIRYKSAIDYLMNVSKGVIALTLPSGQAAESQNFSSVMSAGSIFSRDKSKGFI